MEIDLFCHMESCHRSNSDRYNKARQIIEGLLFCLNSAETVKFHPKFPMEVYNDFKERAEKLAKEKDKVLDYPFTLKVSGRKG